MSLPKWLADQVASAQADEEPDGTTWSAYATTEGGGLALLAGAHDKADAQRFLDESGHTGLVAPSPRKKT